MSRSEPPARIRAMLLSNGLDDVSIERLGGYLDALLAANESMNLTTITDRDAAWERHIADSLSLLPLLRRIGARRVIDVGSGGGLPGIPLAIALPDVRFTLVDARAKKVAFLREGIARLGLANVDAIAERAETLGARGSAHREAYDAVIARALAPMPVLLELTLPLLRVGGVLLAIKGERYAEELAASERALSLLKGRAVEEQRTPTGMVVVIEKLAPTPPKFPRKPGEPKKAPL